MLTTRGGAMVGAGAALVAAWVMLGEIELLGLAAALAAAVLVGLAITGWNRPQLVVERRLHPNLVHEGDRATVELRVTNHKRLPLPELSLSDGIEGLGRAGFSLGSLPGGDTVLASYRIVCRPRGVYMVGPASIEVHDPLRLTTARWRGDTIDQLIVYPAVEALTGFPVVRGRDPATMASRPQHSQRGGEDFYTLRPYADGDDLRRVHWPTSAKLDELMIRQMETPWQSRALVLLDVRSDPYPDDDSFEKAVSGAASAVHHLVEAGFSGGLWSGRQVIDIAAYAAAMESLARVHRVPGIDLRLVASRLRAQGGGLLILVSGRPDRDLLGVYRLLGAQHRATILLSVSSPPSPELTSFQRTGAKTVLVKPNERWAPAWQQAIQRTWTPASAG
ncbi:MAG TPA: DUF58 domain-containing protein [Acidimicrobiia bacterium]|nr:DUF58 domain-containing protein [Acidimicrobiia bacterium]